MLNLLKILTLEPVRFLTFGFGRGPAVAVAGARVDAVAEVGVCATVGADRVFSVCVIAPLLADSIRTGESGRP